jgi:hypothetical protein
MITKQKQTIRLFKSLCESFVRNNTHENIESKRNSILKLKRKLERKFMHILTHTTKHGFGRVTVGR